MMTINNVSVNSTISNVTSAASTMESRALQTQLNGKQQRLNRLSSDIEMTVADKESERREIRREIAELNRKLLQERRETKEEAKESAKQEEKRKIIKEELFAKNSSDNDADSKNISQESFSDEEKDTVAKTDIPMVTIRNMLSASSVVAQNAVTEKASGQLNNQKNILEAEIQSDTLYGMDTTAKKETLSTLQRKKPFQIESLNKEQEQVTPAMNFGSKIVIRE